MDYILFNDTWIIFCSAIHKFELVIAELIYIAKKKVFVYPFCRLILLDVLEEEISCLTPQTKELSGSQVKISMETFYK